VLPRPWRWVDKWGEGSMSRTRAVQTHWDWKTETGEEQSQEHAHNFLWHQVECSQRICPCRPNSNFHKLLWCFMMTAWKCFKTSPRTSATRELAVASWQRTISHFLFHKGIFYQKKHDCRPRPTLLTWLGLLRLFYVSLIEERCICMKCTTLRVTVASRPKDWFWPDGSTSPGNYGWLYMSLSTTHPHSNRRWHTLLFICLIFPVKGFMQW
jgi:hypothetical protein